MTILKMRAAIDQEKARSAWSKGVKNYAHELLDNYCGSLEESEYVHDKKILLNGADSWKHYSWSGCSYCYDEDIAQALCNPSELKKTKGGLNRPNSREEWLDVQVRALTQAERLLYRLSKAIGER